MAKRIADERPTELAMLPGEDPDTSYVEDARQWVTVYSELAEFVARSLARLAVDGTDLEPLEVSGGDPRYLDANRRHLESRLEFWQRRAWALGGIDFDAGPRRLRHRGREVLLTRREAQLFSFLSAHPGQFFTAERLKAEAWHAPYLSEEQLRSYVTRLRARIRDLAMPTAIRSVVGRGYTLFLGREP